MKQPVKPVEADEDAGGEHPTHPGGNREVGSRYTHQRTRTTKQWIIANQYARTRVSDYHE